MNKKQMDAWLRARIRLEVDTRAQAEKFQKDKPTVAQALINDAWRNQAYFEEVLRRLPTLDRSDTKLLGEKIQSEESTKRRIWELNPEELVQEALQDLWRDKALMRAAATDRTSLFELGALVWFGKSFPPSDKQ